MHGNTQKPPTHLILQTPHPQRQSPGGTHRQRRHRPPLTHTQLPHQRHNHSQIPIRTTIQRQTRIQIWVGPHRRMPAMRIAGLVHTHCGSMLNSHQPHHQQKQRNMYANSPTQPFEPPSKAEVPYIPPPTISYSSHPMLEPSIKPWKRISRTSHSHRHKTTNTTRNNPNNHPSPPTGSHIRSPIPRPHAEIARSTCP